MTQKALLQSAGDGTAAPSGYVGETISSKQSTATNVAATGQYHDTVTITLNTSGTYRFDGHVNFIQNAATIGNFYGEVFLGTTTGNSTTGLDQGENYWMTPYPPNTATDCSVTISAVGNYNSSTGVLTLAAGATLTLTGGVLRLKCRLGSYSAGTPQYKACLIATRIA